MKIPPTTIAIVLGFFAFACLVGLSSLPFCQTAQGQDAIRQKELLIQSPASFSTAGQDLAELCQTCQQHPDWLRADANPFALPWLPPSLQSLHPTSVDITPDYAHVEFGGGFFHFGYDLTRESNAVPSRTNWVLQYGDESGASHFLQSYTLSSTGLTEKQFVKQTLANLDRRIAANEDAEAIGPNKWYASVERLNFAVQHHAIPQAIQAMRNSAKNNPQDWRDTLFVYLLDRASNPAGAEATLKQWAATQKDFSAWLLAAIAFDAAGDFDAATRAALQACQYPADDPDWLCENARSRSVEMCRRLYNNGMFDACDKLCQTLLAYHGTDYLQAEIAHIDQMARSVQPTTQPAKLPAFEDGIAFDPFKDLSINLMQIPPTSRP